MKIPALLAATLLAALPIRAADFDWQRAKEIHRRSESGQTISPEEQKILEEAKRLMASGQGPGGGGGGENRGGSGLTEAEKQRAMSIMERERSGQTISPEDKAFLEDAKRRYAGGGGGQARPQQPDASSTPRGPSIDWNRARELGERVAKGEKLSAEDQRFYDEAQRIRNGGRPAESAPAAAPANGSAIDWERARALFQREQRGEKLAPDDLKYLDEAKRLRERGAQAPAPKPPGEIAHFTPLTELTATYQGRDGGLYGGGRNEPPPALASAAQNAAAQIRPLDAAGKPSDSGRIVLLSIGMSNTTQEFSLFKKMADDDSRKSPKLVIVDGAQGGRDAPRWANADAEPWSVAAQRIADAGVTAQQVQVVWIKQAIAGARAPFPAEADRLRGYLGDIVRAARQHFPNLRIAYLSSRIYAGYATTQLNPEPHAYEAAFAIRDLIEQQGKGDAELNFDPGHGAVRAPLLLWGPYLWADGATPRKADGLSYVPEDFGGDGTHPSNSGREKVAQQLLAFFTKDPTAVPWFVKK